MLWATFWALFSQTNLATLATYLVDDIFIGFGFQNHQWPKGCIVFTMYTTKKTHILENICC
jgi:hypothetical protein